MAAMPLPVASAASAPSSAATRLSSVVTVGFDHRVYTYASFSPAKMAAPCSAVPRWYVVARWSGGTSAPVDGSGLSPAWMAMV